MDIVEPIEQPSFVVAIHEGHGQTLMTAKVHITFGPSWAHVTTSFGDHEPLRYRGHEFTVVVNLTRTDGPWFATPGQPIGIVHLRSGGTAPVAYREPIIEVVCAAVNATWTPEIDRQAHYANAVQDLAHLTARWHRLIAALAEVKTNIAEAEARRDAHLPQP